MSTATPAIARLAALLPGYGVALAAPLDGPAGDDIRSAAARLGALMAALAAAGVFDKPDEAVRRAIAQAAREVAQLLDREGLIRTPGRVSGAALGRQDAPDAPARGPLAEAPPLDGPDEERTMAEIAALATQLHEQAESLGRVPAAEQHAMLSVLAGRFRAIHDAVTPAGCRSPASVQGPLSALHATLVGLVRSLEAGYVLPLKLTHREDWARFVERQQALGDQLATAREVQKAREVEPRAILEEIEDGEPGLRLLPPEERRAIVSVWAGKVRRAQVRTGPTGEAADLLRAIFGRLMAVAGDPAIGEVPAMRREFTCDWDVYIATHEAKVTAFTAAREADATKSAAREEEAARALEALAAAVDQHEAASTPESAEAVRAATVAALHYGVTDALLDIVARHEALFAGREFRALRNRMAKERESARTQPPSVSAAVEAAAARSPRLNFTPDALRSARESDFRRPARVAEALDAIQRVAEAEASRRESGASGKGRVLAFRELGFKFKEFISQTAEGKWGDEYRYLYNGQSVLFAAHITLGTGGACSIHMNWDAEPGKVVIAHVGKHKTNTRS